MWLGFAYTEYSVILLNAYACKRKVDLGTWNRIDGRATWCTYYINIYDSERKFPTCEVLNEPVCRPISCPGSCRRVERRTSGLSDPWSASQSACWGSDWRCLCAIQFCRCPSGPATGQACQLDRLASRKIDWLLELCREKGSWGPGRSWRLWACSLQHLWHKLMHRQLLCNTLKGCVTDFPMLR